VPAEDAERHAERDGNERRSRDEEHVLAESVASSNTM